MVLPATPPSAKAPPLPPRSLALAAFRAPFAGLRRFSQAQSRLLAVQRAPEPCLDSQASPPIGVWATSGSSMQTAALMQQAQSLSSRAALRSKAPQHHKLGRFPAICFSHGWGRPGTACAPAGRSRLMCAANVSAGRRQSGLLLKLAGRCAAPPPPACSSSPCDSWAAAGAR